MLLFVPPTFVLGCCKAFRFTDCVSVWCLLILTFKKLLKSHIFISPQGKTLRRDLYVAFSFVKHLLYAGDGSVEELLRGP